MCAIVSTDWSHSERLVAWGNPLCARRSLVQHLSRQASQLKKFTLGGAQDFQLSLQEPDSIATWKRAS
jgi:hypothetical protein